jgi:hypothetical protein
VVWLPRPGKRDQRASGVGAARLHNALESISRWRLITETKNDEDDPLQAQNSLKMRLESGGSGEFG